MHGRFSVPVNFYQPANVTFIETAADPPREVRGAAVNEAAQAFRSYYRSRRVYLPEATCEMLDGIERELRRASIEFSVMVDRKADPDIETWDKSYRTASDDIPEAMRQLRADLKLLLGAERVPGSDSQASDVAAPHDHDSG